MEYKGFCIKENKMDFTYGKKKWNQVSYVVYKEINDEKYFLPGTTAFDSVDEAKKAIDELERRFNYAD